MPMLIPVVAAIGGWVAGGMVTVGMTGLTAVVVGAAVGAVVGAAIGAIGALVTGGDIGANALSGAIGGAVGGAIGGYGAAVGVESSAAVGQADVSGLAAAEAAQNGGAVGGAILDGGGESMFSGLFDGSGEGGLFGGSGNNLGLGTMMLGGKMMEGNAQEEAMKANIEAQRERDAEGLKGRLAEIAANSQSQMEAIGAQGENAKQQLAEQHKNNLESLALQDARATDQLKLKQLQNVELRQLQAGLDQDAQDKIWAEDDEEQAEFNTSVVGALENTQTGKGDLVFNKKMKEDPRFVEGGLLA